MTPCSRILRITASTRYTMGLLARRAHCVALIRHVIGLGQDRRFVARTHQRAEHAMLATPPNSGAKRGRFRARCEGGGRLLGRRGRAARL